MADLTSQSILSGEAELIFPEFTSDDALELGLFIVKTAREDWKRNIAIHIETDEFPLFTHFMERTDASNLYWVTVKKNVVKKFGHSSLSIGLQYKEQGKNFHEETGLKQEEFRAEGGSVPLVVRDKDRIGSVTVSGMTGEEDHALAILGMQYWLKKKICP